MSTAITFSDLEVIVAGLVWANMASEKLASNSYL